MDVKKLIPKKRKENEEMEWYWFLLVYVVLLFVKAKFYSEIFERFHRPKKIEEDPFE